MITIVAIVPGLLLTLFLLYACTPEDKGVGEEPVGSAKSALIPELYEPVKERRKLNWKRRAKRIFSQEILDFLIYVK